MTYEIVEHEDFYEVVQADGLSVLCADRHDNALIFLRKAVSALNSTPNR